MARIIAITSGKNGVGKTSLAVNLALSLSGQSLRTCLFDADMGLANINNPMGIYPELDLEDMLDTNSSLEDIIATNYQGVDIIPGNFGVERLFEIEGDQVSYLINSFSRLQEYDFVLIDLPAGFSKTVALFAMASSELITVTTPDPDSLSAVRHLIEMLRKNGFERSVMVVINQSGTIQEARSVYTTLKESIQEPLNSGISPLGTIVLDSQVLDAERLNKPFVSHFPNAVASKCITNIRKNLVKKKSEDAKTLTFGTFWERFFKRIQHPVQYDAGETEKTPEIPKTPNPEPALKAVQTPVSYKNSPVERPPGAFQTVGPGIQGFQALLGPVVASLSSISEELSRIRKILENGQILDPKTDKHIHEQSDPVRITLDLDEFIKNHRIKEKQAAVRKKSGF